MPGNKASFKDLNYLWLSFSHSSQDTDTDVSGAIQGVQKSFLDAIKHGQLDKVKTFHQEGANLMAPDGRKWTPLHHAARLGRTEIVQYIADHGECEK